MVTEPLELRLFCFLACIPSGGALLAKVYGVSSMQTAALAVALPCSLALVGVLIWACQSGREPLSRALIIGFVGGLLGSIAYDLIRIPFHMAGQRIFIPISTFGVWLAEADSSSRVTEAIGWTYHYWNGVTFGIMYALFMRHRHFGWAIVWAFLLETIAIFSPFGRIFSLSGNYYAIGIAYLGHVAYGLPLGWLVQNWDDAHNYLANQTVWLKWVIAIPLFATIIGPLISPERIRKDSRIVNGEFQVEGDRLNPDLLRIERGGQVQVSNVGTESVWVRVKQVNVSIPVAAGQKKAVLFPRPGIYQLFVETNRQSRSSFVIVEPVEQLQ